MGLRVSQDKMRGTFFGVPKQFGIYIEIPRFVESGIMGILQDCGMNGTIGIVQWPTHEVLGL